MNSITACLLLAAATAISAPLREGGGPEGAGGSTAVDVPSDGNAAGWDIDPVAWHREGDVFVGDNSGRALAPSPKGRRVEIRARVTPQASRIPEYASIGLAVFDDLDRYWNFAILKGPASKGSWHRYELKAQGDGEWGIEERFMTRVTNKRNGEWKWGQSLDMALSFSPERVEGVVTDAASGVELYRCAWVAKDGAHVPVPAGRPSIFTGDDFSGRVENVEWSVEDEVPGKTREFPPYRPVGPETGIKGHATGFFHMEKIDGRDWAIDPLGRATILAGTDWCTPRGSMCEKLGYRPYGRWVQQHYASTEDWAAETTERLGSWGFTVLPCGGDPSLFYRNLAWMNAADRVYFSHRMCRGDPDWRICEYRPAPCTAFPNVFHPDFEAACDWWARHRCAQYRDDPWLVGYFIDNELAWWGEVSANKATGLWDTISKKPDTHSAKKALLQYVAECQKGRKDSLRPERPLTAAEGGNLSGEAALNLGGVSAAEKLGFLRLVAERYFSAVTAAIRRADPNHMILGCRFAGGPKGVHPVVMEVAGKYCDIVSFNHYPWADLDQGVVFDSRSNQTPVTNLYRQAHDLAKKPFFLTEWSFPALDTGRPCLHGAGQRFQTQAERVQASELYLKTLLSLPFFAGHSFFRWVDLPALGIRKKFPEDSNYGLVSEENVPYEGLTRMFTRLQTSEHPRMHNARCTMHNEKFGIRHAVTNDLAQISEHERYFAEAATTNCALCIVHYAFSPDGTWVMSNGLVRLSGRIGGRYMADEVAYSRGDGVSSLAIGRWGALLQGESDDIPYWVDISRVTEVSFTNDTATGIVSATIRAEGVAGEAVAGGATPAALRFAFTHRLSLSPGTADVLAEILLLENTGDVPFTVSALFMRPFAIEREPGETFSVPNLWKGPVEGYWLLSDGSRWGVSSYDQGVLKARLWRKDGQTAQHPDVRCMSGGPFTLVPGKTYAPPVPMGARIRFLPK